MKTFVIILSLAVVGLSITSCQKEITGEITLPTDTTGTVNPGFLVKTYTEDITSLTVSISLQHIISAMTKAIE